MLKKATFLILLLISLICSIALTRTYSKYLLSKNIAGTISVPEVDYCIKQGITNLSDCMLVMENYSTDVDSAKIYISSKGIPDFSKTAPITNNIEYTEEVVKSSGVYSSSYNYTIAPSYTFDASTGVFTLNNYKMDILKDDYKEHYTCGAGVVAMDNCFTLYQIKEWDSVETSSSTTYRITSAVVHNYKPVDSFDSEIGLYEMEDDYGTSYYYRGNVKNNYVSYAGYIWRIVRQNGDGSLRMIYAGTTTSAEGQNTTIGRSRYNTDYADHTYAGYMYGKNFEKKVGTVDVLFSDFSANTKFYFGSSYSFDENTKTFSITGDLLYGTWKDNYEEIIANYPYTCRGTTTAATCLFALNVTGYYDASNMYAKYLSYSSKDYASVIANTYDSTIKSTMDTWYQKNLLNKTDNNQKLYTNYLSDATFCNDRTFYSGDGYDAQTYTSWKGKKRLLQFKPTLKCSQSSDKFSSTSNFGNALLSYPIALLTSDELIMAGAKFEAANQNFYLFNGLLSATMTPYDYATWRGYPRVISLGTNGEVIYNSPATQRYVRPVINLRADIKITSGDGTAEKPYVVALPS